MYVRDRSSSTRGSGAVYVLSEQSSTKIDLRALAERIRFQAVIQAADGAIWLSVMQFDMKLRRFAAGKLRALAARPGLA